MAYNTKKIALIGILGALTIISLLLAVVLPNKAIILLFKLILYFSDYYRI